MMALRLLRLLPSAPEVAAPLHSLASSLAAAPPLSQSDAGQHVAQALQPCTSSVTSTRPSHATNHDRLLGWAASSMASSNRRSLTTSSHSAHGGGDKPSDAKTISVTYVEKDGKETTVRAHIGENLLQVAHENEVDLEGACEGSLACSTCHVIVEDEDLFKKMPEASEDELDMLDLAYGLSETSRLGCQIVAAKELDGLRVRIPAASRNFYVDGHKPKPH